MPIAGALMSLAIGVALGLFGGGGSILTMPVLLYGFGIAAHGAIATSLAVVGDVLRRGFRGASTA